MWNLVLSLYVRNIMLPNFFNLVKYLLQLEIRQEKETFLKPYWCVTLFVLTHRLMLTVVREPAVQIMRLVQKVVSGNSFLGRHLTSLTI